MLNAARTDHSGRAAVLQIMTPLFLIAILAAQDPAPSGVEALLAPDARVERLATGMAFTEGPVWLPRQDKLVFSDIPGSRLMEWSEAGGLKVFREHPNPNGNMLDLEGRLLTCRHGARDLVRAEADGALTVLCDRFEGKRLNSPNDVALKSDGSLWFTDPPWGLAKQREGRELPGNWVFRLEPETQELTVVIRDLCMPNGIAFSADEGHLYVADTGGHPSHPDAALRDLPATVSAYVVREDGTLEDEPAWRTPTRCDGMCVDSRGRIYTTGRAGVKVLRPDGTVVGTIEVPESPANVCFGGRDRRTLFITARSSLYSVRMRDGAAASSRRDDEGKSR